MKPYEKNHNGVYYVTLNVKPTWHLWNDLLQMTASLGCRLIFPLTYFHLETFPTWKHFQLAKLQKQFLFSEASLHTAHLYLSVPLFLLTRGNNISHLRVVTDIQSGEVWPWLSAPCWLTSLINDSMGPWDVQATHATAPQSGYVKTLNFSCLSHPSSVLTILNLGPRPGVAGGA